MAFEGLFAKFGPALIREAAPHLVQLVSSLGERFRRESREMRETVAAEMAAVNRSQSALVNMAGEQREAVTALQLQLNSVEQKMDRLLAASDATASELASLQQQLRTAPGSSRGLLVASVVLTLATLLTAVALHFRHT